MASSTSTVRKTLKALVFLTCTIGFFYQTHSFLKIYLEYPTVLNIDLEHPVTFEAPAVTVCHSNRLLLSRYCELFEDECKFETYNYLCEYFPRYCPEKNTDPEDGIRILRIHYSEMNTSNEVLKIAGRQKAEEFIEECSLWYEEDRRFKPCLDFTTFKAVQSPELGYPYKCFSVFSLIGKPNEKPMILSKSNEYYFLFKMEPMEESSPKKDIFAYALIHEPRTLANAVTEGFMMSLGGSYRAFVTLKKTEALPSPYKSNCTDFLKIWRENGGHGPLSKEGCMEVCKMNSMLQKHGCVPHVISYPHNFTMCYMIIPDEINEDCSRSCSDGCEVRVYSALIEGRTQRSSTRPCEERDAVCSDQWITLTVKFNRMAIETLKQEPKFQTIEIFSYIGGYLGLWLGVSLMSMFDFVEMMYHILSYPVIKWKRNRKKRRRVQCLLRNPRYNRQYI